MAQQLLPRLGLTRTDPQNVLNDFNERLVRLRWFYKKDNTPEGETTFTEMGIMFVDSQLRKIRHALFTNIEVLADPLTSLADKLFAKERILTILRTGYGSRNWDSFIPTPSGVSWIISVIRKPISTADTFPPDGTFHYVVQDRFFIIPGEREIDPFVERGNRVIVLAGTQKESFLPVGKDQFDSERSLVLSACGHTLAESYGVHPRAVQLLPLDLETLERERMVLHPSLSRPGASSRKENRDPDTDGGGNGGGGPAALLLFGMGLAARHSSHVHAAEGEPEKTVHTHHFYSDDHAHQPHHHLSASRIFHHRIERHSPAHDLSLHSDPIIWGGATLGNPISFNLAETVVAL